MPISYSRTRDLHIIMLQGWSWLCMLNAISDAWHTPSNTTLTNIYLHLHNTFWDAEDFHIYMHVLVNNLFRQTWIDISKTHMGLPISWNSGNNALTRFTNCIFHNFIILTSTSWWSISYTILVLSCVRVVWMGLYHVIFNNSMGHLIFPLLYVF